MREQALPPSPLMEYKASDEWRGALEQVGIGGFISLLLLVNVVAQKSKWEYADKARMADAQ